MTGQTLLFKSSRHWLEYFSSILWPFAIKSAEDHINNLQVDINGLTVEMRCSKSSTATMDLKHYHTFGCPCCFLNSRVQLNPKGLLKWDPWAHLRIYLGHSLAHTGNVALVMNPKTGLVSPQFHVVFDNTFPMVPHLRAGTIPQNRAHLVEHSCELVTDENYNLPSTWFSGEHDPANDSLIFSNHQNKQFSWN